MPVPVYLIAGFLGSGKTTLLKRMLEHLNAQGEAPLVLMNEFGDSNIDTELLEGSRAQMRELIDGCICCTSKTELTKTLYDIVTNDRPSSILLEATGLADPVEILDICTLPNLLERLQLRSIISLVDAERWGKVAPAEALMQRQARYADTLIVNKTDLVDKGALKSILSDLSKLNKRATVHTTVRAEVDIAALFAATGTTVVRETGEGAQNQDHRHDHYLSLTVPITGRADKAKFNDFLNEGSKGLLRLKGFVELEGMQRQAVVQWTGGHWELMELPESLKHKENVLVFIGEHLDREAIRKSLSATGLSVAAPDDHEHSHEH